MKWKTLKSLLRIMIWCCRLALGGGVVLPAPEDIYIFDEAHQLADKAISHQTQQMQLGSTSDWLNTLAKRLKESKKLQETMQARSSNLTNINRGPLRPYKTVD